MNVTIGSMFRDSSAYIQRTLFQQMHGLGDLLRARGDHATFVLIENDSQDDTYYWLNEFGGCGHDPTVLIKRHDDCPYFPSVDRPERWRHLAWVGNATLEELDNHDADRFLYVESDLIWKPEDLLRLIDQAEDQAVCAINLQPSGAVYDTWGHRAEGVRFQASHPYHHAYTGQLMRVESACGATALPAEVAAKTRFQPEDCYVGWLRQVGEHIPVWLDPTVEVIHE